MSRSVTKTQSEILLNKMEANRSIASGFSKQSKEVVAEFWNALVIQLNSAGPPIKNVFEWKKVWSDQKRYVRTKVSANKRMQSGTGGGENLTINLTASEKTIYELIGMKESIDSVDSSNIFGLTGATVVHDKENDPPVDTVDINELIAEVLNEEPSCSNRPTTQVCQESIGPATSNIPATPSIRQTHTKAKQNASTTELMTKEITIQENVCVKIGEIAASVTNHNPQKESSMNRVYRSLEKIVEIKSKKLKELERHNAAMEELRRQEVETKIDQKNKLLEIEAIKLEIMQKKNL